MLTHYKTFQVVWDANQSAWLTMVCSAVYNGALRHRIRPFHSGESSPTYGYRSPPATSGLSPATHHFSFWRIVWRTHRHTR